MELIIANTRGFCAGVIRALDTLEELLSEYGSPIYVRHEIVHNNIIVNKLKNRGVIFVDDINDVPKGAVAMMSAHGVGQNVIRDAKSRHLQLVDGTCPLVTKVHLQVAAEAKKGCSIVVIGHRDHIEVEGILGHFHSDGQSEITVVENETEANHVCLPKGGQLAYVTQTTLATDQTQKIIQVLKRRFPNIIAPHGSTICYATQNRQDAVREMADMCDIIIVVGAPHSSNSRRMAEVALESGCASILIEHVNDLDMEHIVSHETVGLTASASAPEFLVTATIDRISRYVPNLEMTELGATEDISFRLPKELKSMIGVRHDRQEI